jgi:hypothetical protein
MVMATTTAIKVPINMKHRAHFIAFYLVDLELML